MKPRKLKATSVDSRWPCHERFDQSLQDAINTNEKMLNFSHLSYTCEYRTRSPISHSRITYKVIHRNQGCSLLIKLTRVLNLASGLRKQQKFNRHEKRIAMKWMPRLKTRY
jgi:hypothetical protein